MHDQNSHTHAHASRPANRKALWRTFALVVVVLLAELIGGWLSGSLALLSDAAHMATDAVGLGVALLAVHLSARPADTRRSFGYQRVEVLGAALNALMLLAASAYIVYEAIWRMFRPTPVNAEAMLGVALLGLAVNLLGMRWLRGGHDDNMNMRGAYLEVLADMLGSVAVILGALAIRWTGWTWVDPVVAVGIGVWMLPRSWRLLRDAVSVLMEAVPDDVDVDALRTAVGQHPGIASIHDLHVWSIGSASPHLSVHAVLAQGGIDPDACLEGLRAMLSKRFGIEHATVQIEHRPCPLAQGSRPAEASQATQG